MSCSEPEALAISSIIPDANSAASLWIGASDFKSLGEQRVAGEHRDAFAKHFVVGEFAAAIIVVVHRRKIIVDQRVGMDAFHGASQRHGVRSRPPQASAAARQSAGRIRLPPAKSE